MSNSIRIDPFKTGYEFKMEGIVFAVYLPPNMTPEQLPLGWQSPVVKGVKRAGPGKTTGICIVAGKKTIAQFSRIADSADGRANLVLLQP